MEIYLLLGTNRCINSCFSYQTTDSDNIKCWPYEENLSEAKEIMELANQKHEEIKRRLMVVEEELERAIDKSDDCER